MHPPSDIPRAELRLPAIEGQMLLFFAAYLSCAAAGRFFSSATLPFVSFWLPSGLFVATLLRQESRHWPAFAAAAFLANLGFDLANGQALTVGLLFATGNSFAALVGAWLVRRFVAPQPDLSTVREVGGLLGLSALFSTTISATIGAFTVAVVIGRGSFAGTWPLWWSGDVLGVLLLAPLILAWRKNYRWWFGRTPSARQIEAGALMVVVCAVAIYAFHDAWHPQLALKYLMFPCVLWAAFRFGPQVTASTNLVIALFAAWFTAQGHSDIAKSGLPAPDQIAALQFFLAVATLTGLLMSAVMCERQRAEAATKESEGRFRALFEGHSAVKLVVDAVTGKILDANGAAAAFYGWPSAELRQMRIQQINTQSPTVVQAAIEKAATSQQSRFEFQHRRADGSIREVELFSAPVAIAGKLALYSIIHDITERKRAEAALRFSEQQLKSYLEHAGDAIYVVAQDSGRIISCNKKACLNLGYHREELLQLSASDIEAELKPEEIAAVHRSLNEAPNLQMEGVHRRKDGATFSVEINLSRLDFTEPPSILSLVRDITERKRAETKLRKSEASLRAAQQLANVGSWGWDIRANRLEWSDEMFRIFGLDPAGFSGDLAEVIARAIHPDDRAAVEASNRSVLERGHPMPLEYRVIRPDGTVRTVWAEAGELVLDAHGRPAVLSGIVHDITERKRVETAMELSLREKESLLKEVHHRVKNNLQVITSLLRMEARRSDHSATKSVLQELTGRILSMALLHESLYRSGTFAAVDLGAYLKELANQSFRALVIKSGSIRLHLELASVRVEMDQALPCGLLVNELISNCLKHGFPNGHVGEVQVVLQPVDGASQVRLRVSDTGVGLPADFESKRGNSIGLQLVSNLVRQIDGRLEIGPGPGAVFDLIFTPKHSKSTTSTPPP